MRTAVVMAGGKGTRLRPLTERIPKAMVPLDHRPIMEFVVAALRSSGLQRVLAVLQDMPGAVVEHFGDGSRFGLEIDYLLQSGEVGTAGSVRQAMAFVDDEDLLVASSDILFHGDLMPGQELHQSRGALATVALTSVEDPSRFGAAWRDGSGRIRRFREKPGAKELEGGWDVGGPAPQSASVNAGIYFLNRRVMESIPGDRAVDFGGDLLPALAGSGEAVFGWDLPGYWRDVGTWESLEAARRDVRDLPVFSKLATRWTAPRGGGRGAGGGGRVWVRGEGAAGEWMLMETAVLGQAAGAIWSRLPRERGRDSTLSEVQELGGVTRLEALAALDWLAREGKVRLNREGRSLRVEPTPA